MRFRFVEVAIACGFVVVSVAGCAAAPAAKGANDDDKCPKGTSWQGDACVASKVVCPAGTEWNGSACLAGGAPSSGNSGAMSGNTEGAAADGVKAPKITPVAPAASAAPKSAGFFCFHSVYDNMGEDECRPSRASCEAKREQERGFDKTTFLGPCYAQPTASCHNFEKAARRLWECNKTKSECDVARGTPSKRAADASDCEEYREYPGPADD